MMDLIDDKGNFFGAVNVVNPLVVLMVLGVAGVTLVFFHDSEPASEPDLDTTTPRWI